MRVYDYVQKIVVNLNHLYPLILIILVGLYYKYSSITVYETPDKPLTDDQKNILLISTILGVILNAFLLIFHTGYILTYYEDNILISVFEIVILFLLIVVAYYTNIYRESENDTYSKIASGLWPLLSVFGIILILCLSNIYDYFNNVDVNKLSYSLIPQVKF